MPLPFTRLSLYTPVYLNAFLDKAFNAPQPKVINDVPLRQTSEASERRWTLSLGGASLAASKGAGIKFLM